MTGSLTPFLLLSASPVGSSGFPCKIKKGDYEVGSLVNTSWRKAKGGRKKAKTHHRLSKHNWLSVAAAEVTAAEAASDTQSMT